MVLSWAIVKMKIHRRLSWSCKSAEHSSLLWRGTMTPQKYSHNHSGEAPSCCNHNPGSCSIPPQVQRQHPGQFFPLLTHNITCSFLCTPCSLFKGLRFFCGAREEVWRIQSLFFRHNSSLIPSGVTWVSWRVWHGCEHSTHILKLPLTLHGGIHVPASKAVVSGLALFSFDTQKCLPRWKNPPYKSSRALPCW